jgi:hypothetical protein
MFSGAFGFFENESDTKLAMKTNSNSKTRPFNSAYNTFDKNSLREIKNASQIPTIKAAAFRSTNGSK